MCPMTTNVCLETFYSLTCIDFKSINYYLCCVIQQLTKCTFSITKTQLIERIRETWRSFMCQLHVQDSGASSRSLWLLRVIFFNNYVCIDILIIIRIHFSIKNSFCLIYFRFSSFISIFLIVIFFNWEYLL